MKKNNKKQMTKFDYKIRSFVIFAILIFAITAMFVYPNLTKSETKNNEIQEQINLKQKEIDEAQKTLDKILEDQTLELKK